VTSAASGRPWLAPTDRPLADIYDVALLDLDGVVYLGRQRIDGVPESLAAARDHGMRMAFVTNNASRSPSDVAAHLVEIGVAASADDVVTSSQAAAHLVAERLGPGAFVLVVGSPALRDVVKAAGLTPVDSADDRPDAVVQGFWPELRYADLAEAALAVRAGALWVATNADSTLPSPRGLLPGNGSLVGVVRAATGTSPVIAGKPELPLHAEGVRRTKAVRPLVVGDRLDTDIEGANAAQTPSLLVLTGVTSASDLVAAATKYRPTYLSPGLSGLLEPHPEVEVEGQTAHCSKAEVLIRDDTFAVEGDGAPIDALRALLALAWTVADNGQPVPDAARALAALALN
jgi:HAD superfamily hydrolase (TIGR01450 family)